jgi:hypothetical protein
MMLIEHLRHQERIRLIEARSDVEKINVWNRIVWRALLERWDEPVWSWWIFKKLRVRDLESLWVTLFGPRPRQP